MTGCFLESLTWQQAEVRLTSDATILIPIGARCKQHGPHLPLNTDWLTAEYLTKAIVEQHEVISLPTIAYGYYPAFVNYPGSTHIHKETFGATVRQIIESIVQSGPRRFYLLNTGISTNWALEPLRLSLVEQDIHMIYSDMTTLTQALDDRLAEQPLGSHADELETSIMLYIHPDKVDMRKAVPELTPRRGPGPFQRDLNASDGVISPTGSWGDPTLATAQKGQQLVEATITAILKEIQSLESSNFQPAPPNLQYLDR